MELELSAPKDEDREEGRDLRVFNAVTDDLHASALVAGDSAFSSVKDCLISLIAFLERAGEVEVVVDAS